LSRWRWLILYVIYKISLFDNFSKEATDMKTLSTWSGKTTFEYQGSIKDGATIIFGNKRSKIKVTKDKFIDLLKNFSNQTINVGTSKTDPPEGSLGAWLKENVTKIAIASYVAPILIEEEYAERGVAPNIKLINKQSNGEISSDPEMTLKELIGKLQGIVSKGGLTSEAISNAKVALKNLGYSYDDDSFPTLKNTNSFQDNSRVTPMNLAEALLWKLGKWKSYKKFTQHFTDDSSKPTKTDVVFFAFAKHLKDPKNPIYDQHAIRAIWAICGNLDGEEKNKCKNLLMTAKGTWKQTGSGKHTVDCYNIFMKHIDEIVKAGASKKEIDLLLMPLGQALKDNSKDYKEFSELCSWVK
jgi:hypothetical protein